MTDEQHMSRRYINLMTNEQHTSRRYINLDWADVEAWVKSNPRTDPHPRLPGRYVTPCPVCKRQSQSNDLNVWKRDNGSIGLTCRGNCTYRAMLEAIDNAIKTSDQATPPPQVETPPAAGPLTAAAIESHWPTIFQAVEPGTQWHKVTTLLRDARVAAVDDDVVILQFDYPFHTEQVNKPENRLLTEKALQRVFGRPFRVRAVVKSATERSTVAANPEKEIKPSAPSDTEDIEPPPVTKPRIEALEEEWYSPEAQLALDQLIDEQFADEQTAEYWENQATDTETKRKQEREKRVAAENTAQKLQASVDKLSKDKDKVQDKLDKLGKNYKSVKGKLSRRNKKIEGLEDKLTAADDKVRKLEKEYPDLLEAAGAERDKERAARKKLEEELPVSKSEAIKDAWELLDQVPNAAIKEAWTRLETELYQALRHTLNVPGSRPKIQVLLNNAKNEKYINSEQFLHLLVMYNQRNKTTHPDEITRTTLQLTKPEARAALAYLEPIIDKLGSAKASSQDLKRLKAHLSEGR